MMAEPDGEFVAVWVGGSQRRRRRRYIRWAHKPAGGDWSAPATSSPRRSGQRRPPGRSRSVPRATSPCCGPRARSLRRRGRPRSPRAATGWETADSVPNAPGADLALAVAPDGSAVVAFAADCGELLSQLRRSRATARPAATGAPTRSSRPRPSARSPASRWPPARTRAYTVVWGEARPRSAGSLADPSGRGAQRATAQPARSGRGRPRGPSPSCRAPRRAAGPRASAASTSRAGGDDARRRLAAGRADTGDRSPRALRTGTGPWNGTPETVGRPGLGRRRPAGGAHRRRRRGRGRGWSATAPAAAVARGAHRNADGSWISRTSACRREGDGSRHLGDLAADGEGNALTALARPGRRRQPPASTAPGRASPRSRSRPGGVGEALPFSAAADDNWSGVGRHLVAVRRRRGRAAAPRSPMPTAPRGDFTATATATDARRQRRRSDSGS